MYLTLLFVAALVLVGVVGEISGFRAFVCSRNADDFARRVALLLSAYLIASLLLAFILVHVLLHQGRH